MIDLNAYEIIDLTHEMYNGMPGWITHTNFTVEQLMIMERDGYSVKRINMNTPYRYFQVISQLSYGCHFKSFLKFRQLSYFSG